MKRCRTCQIQRACDKINGMKKHDFLLVGIVLAAALLFFLVRNMLIEPGNVLEITVDGETYGTYSLQEDQTIEIGGGNICRIEGGEVSMIWADCPDQLCVHQASVGEHGGNIICLPNRVVLSVGGYEEGAPVDTVVS